MDQVPVPNSSILVYTSVLVLYKIQSTQLSARLPHVVHGVR